MSCGTMSRAILWPLVVALIDRLSSTKLAVNNQLLTVLGVILGLVISFRTTTAYERSVNLRTLSPPVPVYLSIWL
jgi:predicted membrane chloride channel (bestrophin family)